MLFQPRFRRHRLIKARGRQNGLISLHAIFHTLSRSSAIALAVISIGGTAVAESMSKVTGAGGRQTPARTIHIPDPARRTRVPEMSVAAPTSSLTRVAPGKSNRWAAERMVPGIPGAGKGGNRLKARADYGRVPNIPGNRIDDNIFNRASTPATVKWVVAKKCGWICVVRKF